MTLPLASSAARAALVELGTRLRADAYRFVTVTPATHRRVNGRPENARAHDLRGALGWSRPFGPGVLPAEVETPLAQAGLLAAVSGAASGAASATPPDAPAARRALVRASTIGDRLYFHSAWPTHDDDAVFFGPDTYRYVAALQRALASASLQRKVERAIDIGCGAGPGAIELALRRPEAMVYGADINGDALALAEVNAAINGASNLVPVRSDLLDGVDGGFDVIMSNPPYILDKDELAYRHGGGEHGAQLSIDIVHAALDRLNPGGSLLLYTGVAIVEGEDRFLAAIRERLDAGCAEWRYEELDPDIFGGQLGCEGYERVERIAAVWLHAVRRG
ncbi:class I SAM-dependent methyltransferase [Massilia forsythiae]|uniref:Class I SAM-dependent methyltransferase n=1 Tax=Massilia forsythiae TaxID=2728020 RepID=A0A7Z2ZV35_9BURK|nr:class I SAM-dependent methyltransferase [Massilia forsythiae]QJE02935.1 class I SAM-dependent methyltransferase [Massilia forsythiae]